MQCSVRVVVEVDAEAGIAQMEQAVREAGRQAMRSAVKQAVRGYEAGHPSCPACGSTQSQSQGTVARRLATGCGRVVVPLRRQRCRCCGRRFRPAHACLEGLGRGSVTPE
jgi:hypothetical protein